MGKHNFFHAQDFGFGYASWPSVIADIANEKLNKLIDESPIFYGDVENSFWSVDKSNVPKAKHIGRLVFIEELKCNHKPVKDLSYGPEDSHDNYCCKLCGVAIEVIWSVKK